MVVNKFVEHLYVLPEDDAIRQIANGFYLDIESRRKIQILPEVGGWARVRDKFVDEYISVMNRFPLCFMVLLVDFDEKSVRLRQMKDAIPPHLADRVFVLGPHNEPEDLKRAGLGSYEEIGRAIADDCREQGGGVWDHPQLQHNQDELTRLRKICGFLL